MGGVGSGKKKTTTGLILQSGEIQEEYNLASFSEVIEDIEQMRKSDCVAAMALEALKLPILRANIEIVSDYEDLKQYIKYSFDSLRIDTYRDGGFKYFFNHLLLSLDYGIILFEPVWELQQYNGKWVRALKYMSPIRPDRIYKTWYNDNQEIQKLTLKRYTNSASYEEVDIDIANLFIVSYNEEFYDIKGNSVLRKARQAWKYKDRVLRSLARAKARQAGIPKIKLASGVSEDIRENAHIVGRTLGNNDNAYVVVDENTDVELLSLQESGSLELLQYLDRQMLINTLTQFMIAGIGENGSRAATSELKTPYELKINELTSFFEDVLNRLVIMIIENSYYYGTIPNTKYPIIKLSVPVSQELDQVAGMIQKISQVISITEDDEKYIRGLFNLPVKQEEKKKYEVKRLEKINRFDAQEAENLYTKYHERIKKEIELIHKEMVTIIVSQIGGRIERKNIATYIDRVNKIWYEYYLEGRRQARVELGKISMDKTPSKKNKNKIARAVKTLYYDIEQYAENLVEEMPKKVKNINEYLNIKLMDAFKMDKTQIEQSVLDGYQEGRIEVFKTEGADKRYIYTSILDEKVCANCAPLDGLKMTLAEWEERGLNTGLGRLNPDCVGGRYCRCTLTPE